MAKSEAGLRPPGRERTGLAQRKRLNPLDSISNGASATNRIQPHSWGFVELALGFIPARLYGRHVLK
ncbi:MAG TPA: hypothetical protein VH186_00370 [Chloroflexia bacterium]|nr:hypothetical protein [Chloroflexia bacterium]